MKVLVQEWDTDEGWQISISKDHTQLDETIAKLKERAAEPQFDVPSSASIDDDHGLAEMVKSDTVFLNSDEQYLLEYDESP